MKGSRRARASAGLTAVGTVATLVTVILIVAGSVLTPSSAAWKFHRYPKWTTATKTVTATATTTVTVTATPGAATPTATVTATQSVPGPTATVTTTVTASPTSSPSSSPSSSPTASATSTSTTSSPTTQTPGIGVYMSGNNYGLDSYTADWAVQPNVASFYMPWTSSVSNQPRIAEYAKQGRTLQVELATKYPTGYATWADIAAGKYDAHIISFIRSLDALGVPVMLSLDNEPDQKIDNPDRVAPNQTPAQYVAAANRVADLIHANSKNVESMVWIAGFKSAATSASFLPAHSKLDNVGWDPYKTGSHPASETPTQLFATFINNVLIPYGYADLPRHINETGIMTDPFSNGGSFSVQTQIDFYKGLPAAMATDHISSVVWFRANSGTHDYIPTDPSVDQAFATMTAQLLG